MKLGFDISFLEVNNSGMSNVCQQYLLQLSNLFQQYDISSVELICFTNSILSKYRIPENLKDITILGIDKRVYMYGNLFSSSIFSCSHKLEKFDVIFWQSFDHFGRTIKNTKQFVLVHDLAALRMPECYPKKRRLQQYFSMKRVVASDCHIIAISNSTKKDILEFYPKLDENRVSVIYNGILDSKTSFDIGLTDMVLEKYSLKSKGFLLFCGKISKRKNIIVILKALQEYRHLYSSNLKLVLCGTSLQEFRQFMEMNNESIDYSLVSVLGWVSDDELSVLYSNSYAFCYPSIYEGFGLPILEAMRAGAPVIASNNSSLPEVGGSAALYFDCYDHRDLIEKIKDLEDNNFRLDIIQKGYQNIKRFSWKNSMSQILNLLCSK